MGRDVSRELEHLAYGLKCALDGVLPDDVVDTKALSALRALSLRLQRFITSGAPTNSIKSSDTKSQTVAFVEWLTLAEAAGLADVHRGTVKRMADSGQIKDNGERGHKRRVEKKSVLFWMGKRLEKQRQRAFTNYERKLNDIPDKH